MDQLGKREYKLSIIFLKTSYFYYEVFGKRRTCLIDPATPQLNLYPKEIRLVYKDIRTDSLLFYYSKNN